MFSLRNAFGSLLFLALLSSCAASVGPSTLASAPSSFHVVAEGPCAKLSVQKVGDTHLLVFGDTGYELGDWNAGDLLPAAQSFVELREDRAFRNLSLLEGLPVNDGGYVLGDLLLGGSSLDRAWLLRAETRYAERGKGDLFDRRQSAYSWNGSFWHPESSSDLVRFPSSLRSLPALDERQVCSLYGASQRFIRTSSFVLERTGDVWIAGRCQGDGQVHTRPTRIRIAHAVTGSKQWDMTDAPASSQLDAIVNIGLYASSPQDLWLHAWEPFKPIDRRVPYLVHFDGHVWEVQHPPMTTGISSISGTSDGTLWATAGYELWRRDKSKTWQKQVVPPLTFSPSTPESSVRLTTVHAFDPDEVWVEGAYRVSVSDGQKTKIVRAAVLFRNRPLVSVLYCDARNTVDKALRAVGGGN